MKRQRKLSELTRALGLAAWLTLGVAGGTALLAVLFVLALLSS